MIRMLFTSLALFKRQLFALAALTAYFFAVGRATSWYGGLALYACAAIPALTVLFVAYRRKRFNAWKFIWRARRFRSIRAGRITLCYAPELANDWDLPLVLSCCRQEFEQLAHTFSDVRLRRGIVYLFPSTKEVGEIFGRPAGGFALPSTNIIVINKESFLRETIRHELVHLFAGKWNLRPPAILREGIAVYLQGGKHGQPLDMHAEHQLGPRRRAISSLLDETFFFRENQQHANYIVAGSFTGFLIRQFGWDRYRSAYRRSSGKDFERVFQREFSLTLEEAELKWRRELYVTNAMLYGIKNQSQN